MRSRLRTVVSVGSQQMFDGWKSSFENLKKLDLLQQKVSALEELSSSIDARTIELQRTSYARSRQTNPLEDTHNKILEAFAELKRRSKDQRHIPHDNTDIVRLLCLCLQQSRSSIQDIMLLIRTTNKIKQEIEEILPQICNILQEINDWDSQICSWQFKRQAELWKVINALSDKIRYMERPSSPLILSSSPQAALSSRYTSSLGRPSLSRYNPDFNMWNSTYMKNMSPPVIPMPHIKSRIVSGSTYLNDSLDKTNLSSSVQSLSFTSLSSLLDKTVEDANQIRKENESLVESFQQMVDTLKSEQGCEEIPETNGYGKEESKDNCQQK